MIRRDFLKTIGLAMAGFLGRFNFSPRKSLSLPATPGYSGHINEYLLDRCATGRLSGVPPYRFLKGTLPMTIDTIRPPDSRAWGYGIQPMTVKTPCAMGVDGRPGSWDVAIGDVVKTRPDNPVFRLLFYGKVRDENDVIYLAHQYPVRCGVIDCRPESTIVARTIDKLRKARKDFWRAQYTPNASSNVEMKVGEKEHLLTLHRTMALDSVWFAAANSIGLALPFNYRDICAGQFRDELCTPNRISVIERGEEASLWTPGKDHAMHAMAYLFVAMKIGKLSMGTSDAITTIQGKVGSLASNSNRFDDPDGDFIDPFSSPGEGRFDYAGGMSWSDDSAF